MPTAIQSHDTDTTSSHRLSGQSTNNDLTTHTPDTTTTTPATNGGVSTPKASHHVETAENGSHQNHASSGNGADDEERGMVITSLRAQVQDLFTQVKQLNAKLITSYDRVSDLEDSLHVTTSTLHRTNVKLSDLETERTQHLAALNTGLLVEKSHITDELTRLMEKATEEAAQRGQAEEARRDIEKELDDLSASLFDQANRMVAEERYARSMSERKAEDVERALKGAEDAMKEMQERVQEMKARKEEAEREVGGLRVAMGKGKWRDDLGAGKVVQAIMPNLISSHVPYQEFLLFVAHLRGIHSSSPSLPAMSTLLTQPFLSRILVEDSEPTLRLDFAPTLNWLSRRSVLSAIHTGQLIIEPIPTHTLLSSPNSTTEQWQISGYNANTGTYCCAMCGTSVITVPKTSGLESNGTPSSLSRAASAAYGQVAMNLFKGSAQPQSPSATNTTFAPDSSLPDQIYIFRLSPSSSSTAAPAPISRPSSTSHSSHISTPSSSKLPALPTSHNSAISVSIPSTTSKSPVYPLCTSSWCLLRLRTTCSLWAFVRSGIIEKVWDEEVSNLLPTPVRESSVDGSKPAVPKRSASRDLNSMVNGMLSSVAGGGGVYSMATNAASSTLSAPPTRGGRSRSSTIVARPGAGAANGAEEAKPPVPPRRRGLWGMASVLGEKAASWKGDRTGSPGGEIASVEEEKKLPSTPPPPPPVHPKVDTTKTNLPRFVAPPAGDGVDSGEEKSGAEHAKSSAGAAEAKETSPTTTTTAIVAAPPPPPPRRSEGRSRAAVAQSQSRAGTPSQDSSPQAPESSSVPAADSPTTTTEAAPLPEPTTKPPAPIVEPTPLVAPRPLSATHAAQSPRLIALPDSRPATPITPLTPSHPNPHSTPSSVAPAIPPRRERPRAGSRVGSPVPSRTSSPVPGGPTHSRSNSLNAVPPPLDASAPSGAASTAPAPTVPPRVPRRAAGRGLAGGSSRPMSVSGLAQVVGAEDVVTAGAVESPTKEPAKSEEGEKKDDGAVVDAAVAGKPEETEEKTSEEEGEKVVASDTTKDETQLPPATEAPAALEDTPGPAIVNSSAEEKPSDAAAEVPATTAITVDTSLPSPPDVRNSATQSEEESSSSRRSTEASETYVGERTWEERTWKELVRLREAMYWARVGGIRG